MVRSEYVYTPKIIFNLERTLSLDRLRNYRLVAAGNPEMAIRLYLWNVALSQSMYAPLQCFEVALRNAIVEVLENPYGINWYENIQWQQRETDIIEEAKDYLREFGVAVGPSAMIGALNLGFWVGLLDRHYENDLWRPHLRRAFPNAPNPLRRKDVYSIVHRLRKLRNRIAHHEPIFSRQLSDDHELILQFVSWICVDTSGWLRCHSCFEKVWNERPA